MSNSPYIKTHAEILAEISEIVGITQSACLTDTGLRGALSRAIRFLSGSLQSEFCIPLCDFECGQCEYPLPCCGVTDIIPEVACHGCGKDECYERLPWWEIKDGKLIVDPSTDGNARATIRTPAPELLGPFKLASSWDTTKVSHTNSCGETFTANPNMILEGRHVNLPPYGWVKVDCDWLWYQCVDWGTYVPSLLKDQIILDSTQTMLSEDTTHSPVIINETDVLRGANLTDCAITSLGCPQFHCLTSNTTKTFDQGATVELGIAVQDPVLFDVLVSRTVQQYYLTQMTQCAGTTQREIALQMLEIYGELGNSQQRNVRGRRKALVKFKGFGANRTNSRKIGHQHANGTEYHRHL